jgi:hypothetical protein
MYQKDEDVHAVPIAEDGWFVSLGGCIFHFIEILYLMQM